MAQQIAVIPQAAQPVQSTQPAQNTGTVQKGSEGTFSSKLQTAAEQQKQPVQTEQTQENASAPQKVKPAVKEQKQDDPSKTDSAVQNAAALSFESILKQLSLQTQTTPNTEKAMQSVVQTVQNVQANQPAQAQQSALPQQAVVQAEQPVPSQQTTPQQTLTNVLPQQPAAEQQAFQTVKDDQTAVQTAPVIASIPAQAQQQTTGTVIPIVPKANGTEPVKNFSVSVQDSGQTPSVPQQNAEQAGNIQSPFQQAQAQSASELSVKSTKQFQSNPTGQTESSEKPEQQTLTGNEAASALHYTAPIPYDNQNVIIPVSHEAVVSDATPAQQIADQIAANLKNDRKEFTMDLFPQDLGKVSVKLVSQSGVLTVEIAASNPKTQSLLLSNSAEIKSMLQPDQPVQVVHVTQDKQWYEQQQESSRQQQQQQEQERRQQQQRSFGSTLSTDDFLTVMQQLRIQAI